MLRNNINNRMKMTNRKNEDLIPFKFRGELNVWGWRKDKLVYHDGGDNTITVWAKHLTMHLLTGDTFSNKGATSYNLPDLQASGHDGTVSPYHNSDGMMVSNEQFWWDYGNYPTHWSRTNPTDVATYLYPMFPTKMLFGTGREYDAWANIPSAEQALLTSGQGWNAGNFDTNISDSTNDYSATTVGTGGVPAKSGNTALLKCRSVNDVYGGKFTGTPMENEYGVEGAIKSGKAVTATDGVFGGTTEPPVLSQAYRGIGKPCFIYCKRDTRWDTSSAEVYLSRNIENNYEHKITFSITMPDQTIENGNTENWWYPYNDYTLKVVGLFADTRLCFNNTVPGSPGSADYYPYNNMLYGAMMAKRYIAPISKTNDLRLTAQWSLYL
jgi:hypothetical protein